MWADMSLKWRNRESRSDTKEKKEKEKEKEKETMDAVLGSMLDAYAKNHVHRVCPCPFPFLDMMRRGWICALLGEYARHSSYRETAFSPTTRQSTAMDIAFDMFEKMTADLTIDYDAEDVDVDVDAVANLRIPLGPSSSSSSSHGTTTHEMNQSNQYDPWVGAFLVRLFSLAFLGYDVKGGITTGGTRHAYGTVVAQRSMSARSGGTRAIPRVLHAIDMLFQKDHVRILRRE